MCVCCLFICVGCCFCCVCLNLVWSWMFCRIVVSEFVYVGLLVYLVIVCGYVWVCVIVVCCWGLCCEMWWLLVCGWCVCWCVVYWVVVCVDSWLGGWLDWRWLGVMWFGLYCWCCDICNFVWWWIWCCVFLGLNRFCVWLVCWRIFSVSWDWWYVGMW